jgi:hypothetical protein
VRPPQLLRRYICIALLGSIDSSQSPVRFGIIYNVFHDSTRLDSTRLAAPAVGMAESSPNTSPGTTALDEFVNSISVGENLYPQDIDSSVDADIDKVRWHKVNPQNQRPVTTNHSLLFRTIFRFYAILRMLGHFS